MDEEIEGESESDKNSLPNRYAAKQRNFTGKLDNDKNSLLNLEEDVILSLAEIFKILGDPTRIRVLSRLMQNEAKVSDIAADLGMGQSAISHQLRVLRAARLVRFKKDGKEVFYSLDDDHVVTLMAQALEHVLHN